MTLRTGEDILIWRRRLCIALYGGIILEESLDLSSDRILNEWVEGKCNPVAYLDRRSGEGEVYSQSICNSAVEGGGWAASRSCRFTPGIEPGTSCTGGWMGLGFGLEDSIPPLSIPLPVAIPTMLVLTVHVRIGHVRVRQRLEDCSWCWHSV